MTFPSDLAPGDVLLYHGRSVFNVVTDLKTGGLVDHVEIYAGHGLSVAARSEGFNFYNFEPIGLAKVRRPLQPFLQENADTWLQPLRGIPYDEPGLLQFINIDASNNGFICSCGASYYLKMGHVLLFADDYPLVKISPRDMELTRELITIWSSVQ